jgi:hypothetical protein
MGRGGKVSSKRSFKNRVSSKDNGSDDSDEDYVVSNEEIVVSDGSDEEYCSSLDGCASEESFGNFVEEEEEEEVEVVRKVVRSKVRSKVQKGGSHQRKIGVKTTRKRRRVMRDDEEEDEDEDEDYEIDDDDEEEEEEDSEDEEFTPDEDDCSDEEEEEVWKKKRNNMKVSKRGLQKKGPGRGRKRRREPNVSKPLRKKKRKSGGLRRKVQYDDDDDDNNDDDDDDDDGEFVNIRPVVRERSKKTPGQRRRRYVAPSDSDLVSSGSSDHDYTISEEEKNTISEEERQQVREAMEFCGNLRTSLRSSSLPSRIQEVGNSRQRRRRLVRKGKEMLEEPLGKKGKEKVEVEEVRTEVVKQVCGICLSEEDKRRVRGTLDCCSHYFCFACIMEWSKVESRCPLCKQRFKTISKPARPTVGIDLREVVIPVPERDQVSYCFPLSVLRLFILNFWLLISWFEMGSLHDTGLPTH